MNVLITDPVDDQCVSILKNEGFTVDYQPGLAPDKIKKVIGNTHALIVRSQTNVNAEILEAGKNLKVVGRAGAGVDNIDVETATRRGIIVMNTPGGNTISTAEHTFSMILALARNIPQANQSLREGKWDRKKYTGVELFEKTLGVIGLGKVGTELARRCLAFGMTVIAFDPMLSSESATKLGVELVDLDEVYARSDFISLHSPLTAETKGMINAVTLAKCKRGVRIINCARGGIINERDLLQALNDGIVAGAALDVFEQEPPTDNDLIQHPHIVVTPHLGASTEEAQEKVAIQISHQIADFLKERGISGAVNGDSIRYSFRKEFQPYFELAEKMGKFLSQLKDGELQSITLTLNGKIIHEISSVLHAVIIKGIFEGVLFEPVNYLNAPSIAKERGIAIQVHEAEEHELYANVLTVSYETAKEQRTFSGTVFGKTDVRIISIDEFHFEIRPQGNLLLYSNIDQPGMLAKVSGTLAKAKINIGGLSLGRYQVGMKALTIIALDEKPPKAIIDEISAIEGVSNVRLVSLS